MPATISFEIEIALDGLLEPYRPATHWDPAEGGNVEDLAILDIGQISAKRVNGVTTWKTTSLLEGVDLTSPAVQRLLSNILEANRDDAEFAVAQDQDTRRAA